MNAIHPTPSPKAMRDTLLQAVYEAMEWMGQHGMIDVL